MLKVEAVIGSGSSTSVILAEHTHLLSFSSQNLERCGKLLKYRFMKY